MENAVMQITNPATIREDCPALEIDADFSLICSGNGLSPRFKDGDYLLIKRTDEVRHGQIVALLIDGIPVCGWCDYHVKAQHVDEPLKLQFLMLDEKCDAFVVRYDNGTPPLTLLGDVLRGVRVLGVVVGTYFGMNG